MCGKSLMPEKQTVRVKRGRFLGFLCICYCGICMVKCQNDSDENSPRESIQIEKRSGPRIDPRGTPQISWDTHNF